MSDMTASWWGTAVASVERIALAHLPSEEGNLFDPRSNCAATIDALASERLLEMLVREARSVVPREYFEAYLPALVHEISRDRQAVMASMQMCDSYSATGPFGSLGVQHCASRIVVRAHVGPDGFVKSVGAKPWEERECKHGELPGPIWRHADTPMWYHRYVLLGIGAGVYRRATELAPEARWTVGALTPFSKRLRAKLHRADPYRWQHNQCEVCRETVDWASASENEFPPH